MALLVSLYVIWWPGLGFSMLMACFFLLGFAISSQVIAYPVVAESNSLELTGSAESLASVLIMSGGFTVSLFSFLLNLHWSGKKVDLVPVYSVANYHFALMALPIGFLLALVLSLLLKETHYRSA